MSGNREMVTSDEVESQLNFIEKVLTSGGVSDEYGEAVLRNQKAILESLTGGGGVGGGSPVSGGVKVIDTENLPEGVVGTASENIPNSEVGVALFNIEGTTYEAEVRASSDIENGEVITVMDQNNLARPSDGNNEAFSMLTGAGSRADSGVISPVGYNVYETSSLEDSNSDGTITVKPGKPTPLATTGEMSSGGYILATGATHSADVKYYLQIDGDIIVGGETETPLGTTNDPFSFPEKFGAVIPASKSVTYYGYIPEDRNVQDDITARIHVDEVQ